MTWLLLCWCGAKTRAPVANAGQTAARSSPATAAVRWWHRCQRSRRRGSRRTPAKGDGGICMSVRAREPMHGKELTSGGARALESDGLSGGVCGARANCRQKKTQELGDGAACGCVRHEGDGPCGPVRARGQLTRRSEQERAGGCGRSHLGAMRSSAAAERGARSAMSCMEVREVAGSGVNVLVVVEGASVRARAFARRWSG